MTVINFQIKINSPHSANIPYQGIAILDMTADTSEQVTDEGGREASDCTLVYTFFHSLTLWVFRLLRARQKMLFFPRLTVFNYCVRSLKWSSNTSVPIGAAFTAKTVHMLWGLLLQAETLLSAL